MEKDPLIEHDKLKPSTIKTVLDGMNLTDTFKNYLCPFIVI